MDGAARQGDQLLEGPVRVAENPGVIRVIELRTPLEGRLGRLQPLGAGQDRDLPLGVLHQAQSRRLTAGEITTAQTGGELQNRSLMAHHLTQAGADGTAHRKHGALGFPHGRQLGRVPHEHQAGLEGMGAAQSDLQQGAIDHRGLVDQHQGEVFERTCGLLSFLTALQIPLAFELQPEQAMDRARIPGGLKPRPGELLTQDADSLVGGSHDGPAPIPLLHQGQQVAGEERLPGPSETAEHKRGAVIGGLEPLLKRLGRRRLAAGQPPLSQSPSSPSVGPG